MVCSFFLLFILLLFSPVIVVPFLHICHNLSKFSRVTGFLKASSPEHRSLSFATQMLPDANRESFTRDRTMNIRSSNTLESSSLQAKSELLELQHPCPASSVQLTGLFQEDIENQEPQTEETMEDVETVSVASYDSKSYNLQLQDVVQIDLLNPEYNRNLSRKIAQRNRKVLNEIKSLPPETHLMLLLCGIPGSGKSTFANRVVEASERFYYCGYDSNEFCNPNSDLASTEDLVQVEKVVLNTYEKSFEVSTIITKSETQTQLQQIAEISTSQVAPPRQSKSASPERPLQLHFLRGWLHYTQDAFKSRKTMESYCLEALWKGYNLIVDRCNFDSAQRKHWIDMIYNVYQPYLQYIWECQASHNSNSAITDKLNNNLNEIKPFHILCVLVPNYNNTQLCIQRAVKRGGSDGLHEADTDWNLVCNAMNSQFQYPVKSEGIDNIYHCRNEKDLELLFKSL
jgi:DNA polymerase III delta prime subunit